MDNHTVPKVENQTWTKNMDMPQSVPDVEPKTIQTSVDFSFCCITFNPINFSLEQNILLVSRQAFILYWELHQVWAQTSIIALICVAKLTECMLWIQSMPNGNLGLL